MRKLIIIMNNRIRGSWFKGAECRTNIYGNTLRD